MGAKNESVPVKRRRIGAMLRHWRTAASLQTQQAAKALGWDPTRLGRVERGIYRVTSEEVRKIAACYGTSDEIAVTEVARAADEPNGIGWWTPYRGALTDDYVDFISLESEAATIRTVHPVVVPGLLQSPSYAREIIGRAPSLVASSRVEALISVRLSRQEVLSRAGQQVRLHALVPESAFLAEFGEGSTVVKDQIRKLLDMANMDHVMIQLIPVTTHPTYVSNGAVTLLTFPHPWSSVASADNRLGGTHTEDPNEIELLEFEFDRIASAALPADESRGLLTTYLERAHA